MARFRCPTCSALVLGGTLLAQACLFPDFSVVADDDSGGDGGAAPSGGRGGSSAGQGLGGDGAAGTSGGTASGGAGAAGQAGVGATGGFGAGAGGLGGGSTGGSSGAAGSSATGGTAAGCVGSCPEDCSNGVDDDGDLDTDCFDDDCVTDSSCSGSCAPAAELPCNTSVTSESTVGAGATDRLGPPAYSCLTGTYDGPERAYVIDVEPGQSVFVEVYGLDGNGALALADVVAGAACRADFGCSAGSDEPDTAAEMVGFASQAGRDYYAIVDAALPVSYSIAVQCFSSSGCRPVRAVEAGQTVSGTIELGSASVTQVISKYGCLSNATFSGPEAAYMFTPTTSGAYRFDLTNLTGNVSLIVVSDGCGSTCATPTSWSQKATTQDESVTLDAVAHQTYYIVIDSYNNNAASYTLSVTAL